MCARRMGGGGGGAIGGSEDLTDRIRKKREAMLEEERQKSGIEVQRDIELGERIQTTRQKAAGSTGEEATEVTASERIRRLRERA